MKEEILRLSKKYKLSHIGSCLSVLPVLEHVYTIKNPNDKVILSGAHSHLTHLLFTKSSYRGKVGKLIQKDIHCNREAGCDASGGSLGHGVGIGIGYALANPEIDVYVIITDGSFMEGSEMEALRIAKSLDLKNLKVHANFNGYTAVSEVEITDMKSIIAGIGFPVQVWRTNNGLPELDGVKGHYVKL